MFILKHGNSFFSNAKLQFFFTLAFGNQQEKVSKIFEQEKQKERQTGFEPATLSLGS
jgi:hypothetical protein